MYLGHGIWARREVEPACQIADLPTIDLIVLSHYHGDHFDDVAARELDKTLPIVSTADAVDKLSALGFERGYPLDTWESLKVRKGEATLNVTAMPGKHSADDAVNDLLMPVNGHLLDFGRNTDRLYRLLSPATRCSSMPSPISRVAILTSTSGSFTRAARPSSSRWSR
ncbi:MBL fold metallo-hydrolase [Mycobacterium interjectum]|uniref:MBL fold metallo-hydrolase n=1 Tax=Mycobacterium interjectum TaxID=33895 RepID=UPI000A8D5676|nr:MBL fold metallo-hydrolase [Mycobacterium interjectum]